MILHIDSGGPRSTPIINQGLIASGREFHSTKDYLQFGKVAKIKRNCLKFEKYDLIIASGSPEYIEEIDKRNLWHKVIHYDFSDTTHLRMDQKYIQQRAFKYFKRSQYWGADRKFIDSHTHPFDYCALDEYYSDVMKKVYYVGCFFSYSNKVLGQRRRNLLDVMNEWNPPNSIIGSKDFGSDARNSLSFPVEDNIFLRYRKKLTQCKIVFTAFPEKYDGDCRIWESFAANTLVCTDVTKIKMPHAPEDGKHCLIFDASNKQSIYSVVDKVKQMSEQKIREIAQAGYNLVKRYHRPINRLFYLINHPTILMQ